MRHYCTLFDSKYLPQGLVLYESLKKHSSEPFELIALAMDEECWRALNALRLPDLKMVQLEGLEYFLEIESLRKERTHQEYCWTMASQLAEFQLKQMPIPSITYLDADMMFFSDPKVIFDEIGDRSIAVIPHRFIPSKKYLEVNGQFNVSLVHFKNTPAGRECLSTWAAQCREKCSATDGCGDQKYLDAWPAKYGKDLCIIENIGAGLAPWNLANWRIHISKGRLFVEWPSGAWRLAVFYHYHEYIHGERLTNYELRPEDIELIYKPYIVAVEQAKQRIESLHVRT